jgi:hypothetical protein
VLGKEEFMHAYNIVYAILLSIVLTSISVFAAEDIATGKIAVPQPAEQYPSLIEYMRTAPVYLSGQIRFEKAHGLFHDTIKGRKYLVGELQPNKDLNFQLNKTELQITTRGALKITVGGIPISVTSLKYNNVTGIVEAHNSILGIDAGDFYVERRIAYEIKKRFGVKLKEAFYKLSLVRKQKNLAQAADMLNAVVNVFDDPPKAGEPHGPYLPTFDGMLTLNTDIPIDQTLQLGPAIADLKSGDELRSSLVVRVPSHEKMQIRGVVFSSDYGINLREKKTSQKSIKHVLLQSFSASEEGGFQITASNGGDDLIDNAILLAGFMRLADNLPPDDVAKSDLVQNIINKKAENGLGNYVREHRAELQKAGVTSALLDAIESGN